MDKEKLEKLDQIRERTGVTFAEADAALTRANGDVVAAIIDLEQNAQKNTVKEEVWVKGNELVEKFKELIKQGNIRRIIIKDEEGKTLVEIPMTIGLLGTVIAPYVAILGGLAAMITKCKIEIIKREEESPTPEYPEDQGDQATDE